MTNLPDLDRGTPQAEEAERSVLGSVLIEQTAIGRIERKLRPDDFYKARHGDIYQAMLNLHRQRIPIDLVTLAEALSSTGALEAAGGSGYLATLMNSVPTAVHVEHYANMVTNAARLRNLVSTAGRISAAAFEEKDADDAERRAMDILLEATSTRTSDTRILSPNDQGDVLLEMIERRSKGEAQGIPTGFRRLDMATGGLRRGHCIYIGARPSAGKSALAECIAENVASTGKTVVFFSIEMDEDDVMYRWVCRQGKLNSLALTNGRVPDEAWTEFYNLAEERSKLPIYLIRAPGITTSGIRSVVDRLSMSLEKPIDLVIIDYLQLLSDTKERGENEENRVARMSRSLKLMAGQYRMPVIVLSQLSRESDRRGADPEPKLSDFRSSGSLEQDADLVIFLWRNDDEADPLKTVRAKIAKQRNGPIGDLPEMRFERPMFRLYEAVT